MNRPPAVSFEKVSKSFGREKVLEDVSVDLHGDELTFIMGPSGVGKSIFLKLALGFERPDSGSIRVWGKNIHQMDEYTLSRVRAKNVLIFQTPALFDFLPVIDNVCFPYIEHYPEKRIEDARRSAQKILASLGFKADIHKGPETVTQAEAKMVVIARALMLAPDYLFFDEPTTGLDELTRAHVDDKIKAVNTDLKKGCTIVSHDVRSALHIADRILLIHNKQIHVDTREPQSLLQDRDPVVAEFFGSGVLF